MRTTTNIRNTPRLRLRPLRTGDAVQIARLAGDWDVARMTARIPYPYTEAQANEWIDGLPDNEEVFAIEKDARLIGLCGLMKTNDEVAEIGYWIGKQWWGDGLATEAAAELIRYAFRTLKIARITCCHYEDNPASRRVIEKLGFTETGRCVSWCDARRRDVPTITYQLARPRIAFLWRPAA